MFDALRKPFFLVALACLVLSVLLELGSSFIITSDKAGSVQDLDIPGMGIPCLAFIDGLLLYSLLSMASTLIISERIVGRIQGLVTFIISLLIVLGSIATIFIAIGLLILMVMLLVTVPFGTLVYMAIYADFPKSSAAMLISSLMLFKYVFVITLILSHQGFLKDKGLILLILTSFLATVVVSFLQGLPPSILVSITDDIAAIIASILGLIWALKFLISSIPAVAKALRIDRAVS